MLIVVTLNDIKLSIATLSSSHRNLITFWLLNQWHYDQVQKLVIHGYLLYFSLGLCGLILFSDCNTIFSAKKEIITLKSLIH